MKASSKRHSYGQKRPDDLICESSAYFLINFSTANIHQMHVIHARGAGCHARQAGQTSVKMIAYICRLNLSLFIAAPKKITHHPYTTPWTVTFITCQNIGWTCSGAKATMHAFSQNLICGTYLGSSECVQIKMCLHIKPLSRSSPFYRYSGYLPGQTRS